MVLLLSGWVLLCVVLTCRACEPWSGWLAGWLVAGTVRVTRSGLVVNRRPLVQAAGVVLHPQARVTLREVLVCRAGDAMYGETASPIHREACGQ